MGGVTGVSVAIDRSSGIFDLSLLYEVAGAFYPEYGEFGEFLYSSGWVGRYSETGVAGTRLFAGGRDQELDPVAMTGPIQIGLDPTPTVHSYTFDFYAVESTGDSSDEAVQRFSVQSAAYVTTAVTLDGTSYTPPEDYPPYTGGTDILIGGSGNDTLRGYDLDDILDGGAGRDRLEGGNGQDQLYGGDGADILIGGDGNDWYFVGLQDVIIEEVANYDIDTVFASINGFTLPDNVENLVRTGNASFRGYGNAIGNIMTGGGGNDLLDGGDGNDDLRGGAGNDVLIGGAGAQDRLDGGDGVDTADYSASSEAVTVHLSAGGISGGTAAGDLLSYIENIKGSAFDDILGGDYGANVLTGNNGNDDLSGGYGNDTLYGGAGNDQLKGEAGNDVLIGELGGDALDGGDGVDTADYSASAAAISINMLIGTASGGTASGDVLLSIENIKGSAFDDRIGGNAAANVLTGNAGNDTIRGAAGNDALLGGDGNDTLLGETGNDRLTGGNGNDLFLFSAGFGRDSVTDFVAGAGSEDVLRIGPGLPFNTFEEVMAIATQSGANTVFRFDADTTLTLLNVSVGSLDASDFLFA